jgi:hypothetical protein
MDADVARGPADERDNAGSHERSWTRKGAELEVYGGEKTRGQREEAGRDSSHGCDERRTD